MFNALVGRVCVVTKSGSNTAQLVGCDTGSNATATNQHTAIGVSELYRSPHLFGILRKIDRIGAVGSQIHNLVSLLLQEANDIHFQRIARVVCADCNTHSASKMQL